MDEKRTNPPRESQARHEGGDPASLQEDPAQFDPTGGTGLMNPENDSQRDIGGAIQPDTARPAKGAPEAATDRVSAASRTSGRPRSG